MAKSPNSSHCSEAAALLVTLMAATMTPTQIRAVLEQSAHKSRSDISAILKFLGIPAGAGLLATTLGCAGPAQQLTQSDKQYDKSKWIEALSLSPATCDELDEFDRLYELGQLPEFPNFKELRELEDKHGGFYVEPDSYLFLRATAVKDGKPVDIYYYGDTRKRDAFYAVCDQNNNMLILPHEKRLPPPSSRRAIKWHLLQVDPKEKIGGLKEFFIVIFSSAGFTDINVNYACKNCEFFNFHAAMD